MKSHLCPLHPPIPPSTPYNPTTLFPDGISPHLQRLPCYPEDLHSKSGLIFPCTDIMVLSCASLPRPVYAYYFSTKYILMHASIMSSPTPRHRYVSEGRVPG
ncbi:uncharacterized protein Bfra_000904 [Botrytis fragariae]|uniref:Uncharacterized protein n=1 Tax=Botrytis fragariae TaxID=1964551 RepID=A0A8H6B4A8_9HELO|nr:uncharacterized protein Bfra_000904 [Botrytis fragariae]KAF5878737.1 hypothetical protein Bfra_000904 [Botrytis fragariae]